MRYVAQRTENGQWRVLDRRDGALRIQAVRFQGEAERRAALLNRDFADADWGPAFASHNNEGA